MITFILDGFVDDDAYYDGDQQIPEQIGSSINLDCSIQCQPYWTEPVLQLKQTLVFPTSAEVSFVCPFHAKPRAKVTWLKDGHIFTPELDEIVCLNKRLKWLKKEKHYLGSFEHRFLSMIIL